MSAPDDLTLWIFAFVLLVLVLGGAGAAASGRAVALAWRPFARVPLYMFAMTGAVGFLHYALFGLPAISASAVAGAVAEVRGAPSQAVRDLAVAFAYPALCFVVLTGWAWLGHRVTRASQMARQYGFAIDRRGPLGWRLRA